MKKKYIFMMLFCFFVSLLPMQQNSMAQYPPSVTTAYAVDFWSSMDVTDEGVFDPGVANDHSSKADYNTIFDNYRGLISLFLGILTATSFGYMVFAISKLSMAGDNEQARRKAIIGILTSGVGLMLMGGATLVVGVFWNAFAK